MSFYTPLVTHRIKHLYTYSAMAGRTLERENPALERLAQLERERQQILSSLRTDRASVNQLLLRPPQPAPNAAALPVGLGYDRGLSQNIESAILAQSAANPSIIDQLRRLQALNSASGAGTGAYPMQSQGLQGLSGFPLRQSQPQLNPLYQPMGPSLADIFGLGLGRDGVTSAVASTLQSQGRGIFPADRQTGFAPSLTQASQASSSVPAVSSQSALIARSHTGIPLSLPVILAQPLDEVKLSSHQVLLRHQIEAFKASEDDVTTHTRGRNKPVQLGQIGIRCRHCSKLPISRRQKGSTYFPATLMGLYQAAQNMSTSHMQNGICTEMPENIKQEFGRLLTSKVTSSGAGRPYWAESAKNLGLVDTEEGIRFIRDLRPVQFANPSSTF